MPPIEVIAFDADDTLWHNERIYQDAQSKFKELLARYHRPAWIEERLYQTEMRNLAHFGYGIKSFALSMIETAVELTEGRVTGDDIRAIIEITKAMLATDVELLEPVADTLAHLADSRYRLMVITKGDLLDQETKVARSGLADYFQAVEVVSQKTPASYRALLQRHAIEPKTFLMVGNSLRSDILPVLEIGAQAVYVPHHLTWAHENATPPTDQPGFYQIEHLGLLPGLLAELEAR